MRRRLSERGGAFASLRQLSADTEAQLGKSLKTQIEDVLLGAFTSAVVLIDLAVLALEFGR